EIGSKGVGGLDFLKTLSSYKDPSDPGKSPLKNRRSNRWEYLGLVNEPCFKEADGPNPQRHGLWLDVRVTSPECPPDPFENEQKYPGVALGARGQTIDRGSHYGYAPGVVGLRLFPNPNVDAQAARDWDPKRFYTDPTYYNNAKLIRPYRVGMSCGFCHVGPNPLKPPADPNAPKWE